jgi:hypothetical protein
MQTMKLAIHNASGLTIPFCLEETTKDIPVRREENKRKSQVKKAGLTQKLSLSSLSSLWS